jgi:hypothetical protein
MQRLEEEVQSVTLAVPSRRDFDNERTFWEHVHMVIRMLERRLKFLICQLLDAINSQQHSTEVSLFVGGTKRLLDFGPSFRTMPTSHELQLLTIGWTVHP